MDIRDTRQSEKVNDCPQFLTVAELMLKTTLSRPTICRRIKEGSIPAIKVGRRVLIAAEYLNQLKEQAISQLREEQNGQ